MRKTRLLFTVILIEGYVVLACELLAIRQLIPFVGSGTEIIAIIISGVLLPLAFGYHFGGIAYKRAYAKAVARDKRPPSIRRILLKNILIALVFLSLGLSYLFLSAYFRFLDYAGIDQRLVQTASYSLLFLVIPVFLLGQTVPLTSNYFSRERLSTITGKMLFFSTTGSFLGSILSTIVLMGTVGVHNTVIITIGLLTLLCLLLGGRKLPLQAATAVGLLSVAVLLNNNAILRHFQVVSDDAYNIIRVKEMPQRKGLSLVINNSPASRLAKDPKDGAPYVLYIEHEFIEPLSQAGKHPGDILIIGAGGFTMGLSDSVNHYTFVDIDPRMQDVAEQDFLHRKLTPNKQFTPMSARAFVARSQRKFDLIILDTYTNKYSIPMECTTREFLQGVKRLLKPNAILAANIISSANFSDAFTVRYDRTFSQVFSPHNRQVLGEYDPYDTVPGDNDVNVIYVYINNALAHDPGIYTDDKDTYSTDRR